MSVKWGVIGAGGIARRRTIPEGLTKARDCELVAVQDVVPGLAQEVAKQFGVARAYEKEADLLKDPEVQAVYIASPAHLHRKHFEWAVGAGKHVLVEKPLAHTVQDAEAMVALARKRKAFCTEGYMMKFHPLHAHARAAVQGGRLGKPVLVRGQLSCWYPPLPGAWRQHPATGGGGSLIDMGTHVFDLFQWILDADIVAVSAFCSTQVHDYPVEDSATVICRFATGCHGIVDAFFCIPDEACLRRLEIYGSQGGILADGTIGQGGGTMRVNSLAAGGGYDAEQKRTAEAAGYQPVDPGEFNMYRAEVEYLTECIVQGRLPEMNTLEDGLQVLRVTAAAYQSAKTGRMVKLPARRERR